MITIARLLELVSWSWGRGKNQTLVVPAIELAWMSVNTCAGPFNVWADKVFGDQEVFRVTSE